MNTMSHLLSSVTDPIFFDRIFTKVINWDHKLDERDVDEFELSWSACHQQVSEICADGDEKFKKIREGVFKRVYQITKDSELAECVSEDIGLIAQSFESGYENEFVTILWAAYRRGEFPSQLGQLHGW